MADIFGYCGRISGFHRNEACFDCLKTCCFSRKILFYRLLKHQFWYEGIRYTSL